MKRALILLVVAACGGKDTTDTAVTDGLTTDGTTDEWTCDPPNYDLQGMTCEQLGTALRNTVNAADHCDVDEDCIAVRAECEHWFHVECWYAVNGGCVDQSDITVFSQAASSCGGDDVCTCGATPTAHCVNHACTVL